MRSLDDIASDVAVLLTPDGLRKIRALDEPGFWYFLLLCSKHWRATHAEFRQIDHEGRS